MGFPRDLSEGRINLTLGSYTSSHTNKKENENLYSNEKYWAIYAQESTVTFLTWINLVIIMGKTHGINRHAPQGIHTLFPT